MIKRSLAPENNIRAVFKAGESQGKSGSFFFFSEDTNFIIKTMTESDLSTFTGFFEEYTAHVGRYQNSLLARIYGVFTIAMKDMVPIHVVLMGNAKKTFDDKMSLKHVFDLKGSLVNRETKKKRGESFKPTTCLKDLNLLSMVKYGNQVRIRSLVI